MNTYINTVKQMKELKNKVAEQSDTINKMAEVIIQQETELSCVTTERDLYRACALDVITLVLEVLEKAARQIELTGSEKLLHAILGTSLDDYLDEKETTA
jgi:hypothetical protein